MFSNIRPYLEIELDTSAKAVAPFKLSVAGTLARSTDPYEFTVQLDGGYGGIGKKKGWSLFQMSLNYTEERSNAYKSGLRLESGLCSEWGKVVFSTGVESNIYPISFTIKKGNLS